MNGRGGSRCEPTIVHYAVRVMETPKDISLWNDTRSAVGVVHVLIGVFALSILMSIALLACSGDDGVTAGEVLQERLQQELPRTLGGHAGSEGALLGSTSMETVVGASRCEPSDLFREYHVVTVNVEITLNRFLDYDPNGRMYVLENDLENVQREESQNRDARAGDAEPAVSLGLQGDSIQPLILRINQGECLRVVLRNALKDESASFHLHGSGLYLADSGAPATASNRDASVGPGSSVVYEWRIDHDEPEGTHYFHSHADARFQTGHGLFGAVIVEPAGSTYFDPLTGDELNSGWAAIIRDPQGSDFREFVIVYHEIGNERYRHLDRDGSMVVQVDPFTSAYRPGSRALNYRSEPFMNRMALQHEVLGFFDPSQAYSSYVFGDPATPIARAYLGDPVKQRLVHGGSEVFHVHHVHGGAVRWRRQPGVEPTGFNTGLDKRPPILPRLSARIDSQGVGPSETYDIENECGAGGCQQSVGDFLIHCHVAHHYIAGMWMFWRVYNTLQDGVVSLDDMLPLVELPDRSGGVRPAVTSEQLMNTTVDWSGQKHQVTDGNLEEWVERQLPPAGTPRGYDASVLDWRKEGFLYLNEPESLSAWPGFRASQPGIRRPFYFDSLTGKLAYPFLRPQLGDRPPFAPRHGPAPYLSPISKNRSPPEPGENGPGSLCPSDTRQMELVIHAINVPIVLNERANVVDPVGQLYVLKDDEERVRADNDLKVPLVIRGNAGETCVDIVLKSELEDSSENDFFSKVNIHVHFVQFDVLATDGVNTGFSYEQSVRPFKTEGELVAASGTPGSTRLRLGDTERFQAGILVGVGMDQTDTFEVRRVNVVEGDTLVFENPLEFGHAVGEIVSTEFVHYRWYPDVQFGTAYFHDHVNALTSWQHGLFGAFISEPPGSTYHDPYTGTEISSGPIADIRTDGVVSVDLTGSFREMVMFIQDDNPLTNVGGSSGSSLNLRVEPLSARRGDRARMFSSMVHGDPATPLLEAFIGDPLVVRALVSATNDVHTWHLDGHWFRSELHSSRSPPINTIHLGISERYDLVVPRAGGSQALPGDYLYYNGRTSKLLEGSWGIVRVHNPDEGGLMRLPGRERPLESGPLCPVGAPMRGFSVVALEAALPELDGAFSKIYVLEQDVDRVLAGTKPVSPMVLHINIGDCVVVYLTNETVGGPVSFHVDMLAFDPATSYGTEVGRNPVQLVQPGKTRKYSFYAHPEIGETVALVRDWGDVLQNSAQGLYGAIVVGPEGALYTHPLTGIAMEEEAGWRVDVHRADGSSYRDFTVFLHDDDPIIGTHLMPYTEQVTGVVGLNYRKAPLVDGDYMNPTTPMMEAYVGDSVRLNVLSAYGEQSHVFSLEGHRWPLEKGRTGSDLLSSMQIGPVEAVSIYLEDGAGLPGDYIYGDHREPYREAGLWGFFRIYAIHRDTALVPLP